MTEDSIDEDADLQSTASDTDRTIPVQTPPKSAKKNDAVKGFGYYTIYTILLAANNYAQLALFKYAPTISTIQLTFIRGLMCALVVLVMLTMRGQSWKKELYSAIDETTIKPLIFRSASSGTCVFIAFISIKYFNVSTVGIVCALKPILTVIMAYFLLSVPVSFLDGLSNGISLGAISLVILGTSGAESTNMETCAFAFLALMMQPILLAVGEILLKQMGKLPEAPVSFY